LHAFVDTIGNPQVKLDIPEILIVCYCFLYLFMLPDVPVGRMIGNFVDGEVLPGFLLPEAKTGR